MKNRFILIMCLTGLIPNATYSTINAKIFSLDTISQPAKDVEINGVVLGGSFPEDTVNLFPGRIDRKYFSTPFKTSNVSSGKFKFRIELPYPHKFRAKFKSEHTRAWRNEEVFVDSQTQTVEINYLFDECSKSSGPTAWEYYHTYIPFFSGDKYNCKNKEMFMKLIDRSTTYDSTLLSYVKIHPNSYVAIWHLIERF